MVIIFDKIYRGIAFIIKVMYLRLVAYNNENYIKIK